jgi:iron complex outermembrane receptor protein
VAYTFPNLVRGGAITLAADTTYTSYIYHNIRNFSGDRFGGYALENGLLSWSNADRSWTLSAFVKNITDKSYETIGFDLATFYGGNIEAYGPPRTWGASVAYSF